MNNMYDILAKLNSVEKQKLNEGWKGEIAGGVAGALGGAALAGPIGGTVGAAIGAPLGRHLGGPDEVKETYLNEIGPAIAAGARALMPLLSRIGSALSKGAQTGGKAAADVAGKAAAGVGRGTADVAKEVGKAAVQNAPAVGMGMGAYEIAKQFADKMPDAVNRVYTDAGEAASAITSVVGDALDSATISSVATAAVKFGLPLALLLGALYGGKKLIDKLLSEDNMMQESDMRDLLNKLDYVTEGWKGAALGAGIGSLAGPLGAAAGSVVGDKIGDEMNEGDAEAVLGVLAGPAAASFTLPPSKNKPYGDVEEGARPDFLDLDRDGNKKEPMKQAARQAKNRKQVDEKISPPIKTNPAERGKYAGKDIGDLKAMKAANLKKTASYRERGEPVPDELKGKTAELNFAIRAKQAHGGKWSRIKEEEMEEGNEFTQARMDAIRAGKPTFSVGGKTFKVTGDTSDEKTQMNESAIEEGFTDFFDKKVMYRKIGADVDGREDDYTVTFKDGTRKRYQEVDGRRRVTTLEPVDRNDAVDDEGEVVKRGRGRPKGTGRKMGARGKTHVREEEGMGPFGQEKIASAQGAVQKAQQEVASRLPDAVRQKLRATVDSVTPASMQAAQRMLDNAAQKYPNAAKGKDMQDLRQALQAKQGLSEDYDQDEYDEEGEMAKSQSRTIADAAQELQSMLDDKENLPEWVQKKITLAMDYIDTARDYLAANRPEGEEIMAEKAVSQAQRRAAGIAYAAKKGDIPKSQLRGASKEMAKMATGELKKFAKTKEKGLPEKKEEVEETTVAGSVATAPAGKAKKGMVFGKGVYESQISESYEKKLHTVLNEGISINASQSEDGTKSLNVNATDDDAIKLAQILQLAGMPQGQSYGEACPVCGKKACGCEELEENDLANSPEEQTYTTNAMVNDLSGGLNGQKTTGQTVGAPFNQDPARQGALHAPNIAEAKEKSLWELYQRYETK